MKYILENFRTMTGGHTPGVITQSGDLRHRFIQGFVPHYASLAAESADADFKKKISPPFPLYLSPDRTSVQSYTSKYPVLLVANEEDAGGKVIAVTDLWEFFAEDSSQTSMGIPSGTPTTNTGIDAVIFNGKVLTSHPSVAALYYGDVSVTPSWTSTGSLSTGVTKLLKTIEDRCLVLDSTSGVRDKVKIVASDFTVSNGITLGDTYDIQDIGVYQDRYALLFVRKTASPRLSPNTTVFLWNCVAGDSYDLKIPLKGTYRCSIERDGTPYVFTQVATTLYCYAFVGGSFREVGKKKNVVVSANTNVPKSRISIEGDFFVLLATSPGNTDNTAPFYWNPFTDESFFLVGAIADLPFRAMLIAQDPTSTTHSYERYFSFQQAGGLGILYKFTLENSARTDIEPTYKSNFIPAPFDPETHGQALTGRIKINRIDIEYSVKSPSANDYISFTLTTKDEPTSETYNTDTATIKNTTANSTNAAVEDKRAIIDNIGREATEFAIDLSAVVATTTWQLIIRRIVIDYTPIAHLS